MYVQMRQMVIDMVITSQYNKGVLACEVRNMIPMNMASRMKMPMVDPIVHVVSRLRLALKNHRKVSRKR